MSMLRTMLSLVVLSLFVTGKTFAGTGISATFIQINNKGSDAWYDLQKVSYLNDFNGYDFGSFTAGDTFLISGSETEIWKNDGDNINSTYLYYRIYLQGSEAPAFTEVYAGYTTGVNDIGQTFQDASGGIYGNVGDQKWAQIASTPNILSGLSQSGTYVIEVYTTAHGDKGEYTWVLSANNDGANYKATFDYTAPESSVPEPAAMSMLVIGGGLAFLARRRRQR